MSNLYAIVENNTITAVGRLKTLWPQVSFTDAGPREDWLIEQGAQPIRYDPPYDPETHDLKPSAPYLLNGVVYALEAWGAGLALGLITAELTTAVSALAVARDLPADFVAALAPPEQS